MTSLALWILWAMMQQQPSMTFHGFCEIRGSDSYCTWDNGQTWNKVGNKSIVMDKSPMDVPAIQVPADSELESMSGGDIFSCSNGGKLNLGHCSGGHTYTCADKSRVLLTDEEGGRHCVKF